MRLMVTWYDGNDSHIEDVTLHPDTDPNGYDSLLGAIRAHQGWPDDDEHVINAVIEVPKFVDYDKSFYNGTKSQSVQMMILER